MQWTSSTSSVGVDFASSARFGGSSREMVDFARAVTGLGVDRGLDSFVRYGLAQAYSSNGQFAEAVAAYLLLPECETFRLLDAGNITDGRLADLIALRLQLPDY